MVCIGIDASGNLISLRVMSWGALLDRFSIYMLRFLQGAKFHCYFQEWMEDRVFQNFTWGKFIYFLQKKLERKKNGVCESIV